MKNIVVFLGAPGAGKGTAAAAVAARTGALGFTPEDLLPALETVLPPKLFDINKKALFYEASDR